MTCLKPKQRSGKISPVVPVAIVILILLAIAGLFWLKAHRERSIPTLPIDAYVANPRGFSGNRYQLNARIKLQLDYDPSIGRLLHVESLDGGHSLPILAPLEIEGFNPSPGQIYRLNLGVDEHGILIIQHYAKR